jgi:Acyclic terpene utilisation family protein AtuA
MPQCRNAAMPGDGSYMKDRVIRIGSGSGFVNDSAQAVPQLLERGGKLDYIMLEYLAEGVMAWLAADEARELGSGFSPSLVNVHLGPHLATILARGIKVVTNGGGLNPHASASALRQKAAALGLHPKIAVVTGDDLRDLLPHLRALGVREMYEGTPLPDNVGSVNAYLGAFPIARALAGGADIVITGRCVDSALVLGPLIHEFGWTPADHDLLAAGTAAGHMLECGAQATGGTFTDWRDVPDWVDIGYPIAECSADGSFVLTKPEATGGLVSVGTVSEQLIYEVQDASAYMVPDVACDFSAAKVEQVGPERVRISNIRGNPPTSTYKVTATAEQGWRCTVLFSMFGFNAAERGRKSGDSLIERTRAMLRARNLPDFTETLVEVLGAETTYGLRAIAHPSREAVCRIVVRHADRAGAELLGAESRSVMTTMSPGSVGIGMPVIAPVLKLFSFLLEKDEVPVELTIDDQTAPVEIATGGGFDEALLDRPAIAPAERTGCTECVPLIGLAWARSGDKGNMFNVGVIARHADYLPYISAALTGQAVGEWFRHVSETGTPPKVTRHDAPGFNCINFLVPDALGGGQTSGMRTDCNGKGMAQQLLSFPVPVPAEIAALARRRIAELRLDVPEAVT